MKGTILEWNNDKGYRRGLFVQDKQIKSLTHQGRLVVFMLDENSNLQKNEKGGNIIGIVDKNKTKVIGFQD
jgi:hypothetical protein